MPCVSGTDHFIEPHVAARRAASEAVLDDGVSLASAQALHALRLLVGATVLGHPVAHGQRHGHVGTPSAFVLQVAAPLRGVVLRAVNLHEGDGTCGFQFAIHPLHRQSGDGSHGLERLLLAVGHQVAHLAAVGHTRHEGVLTAQVILLLDVSCHTAERFYVVNLPSLLEGVAYVPARLALQIGQALRDAHAEAMLVGHVDERILAPDLAAVAVQDEYERSVGLEPCGQIHHELAHVALHLDGVFHVALSPRHAAQRQAEQQRNHFSLHSCLCN